MAGSSSVGDAELERQLQLAAQQVEALDPHSAIATYQQILSGGAPNCIAALDGLADASMQVSDRDTAVQALMRSVELSPDGTPDRYMNLGQLCDGPDALRWLERGAAILRAQRESVGERSGERAELQQAWLEATHALACGLCSIAEVYLTDACDEPDAEEKCEAAAGEAMALVRPLSIQTLAEPYVTCASLRLSQERPDEAKEMLERAMAVVGGSRQPTPPSAQSAVAATAGARVAGAACQGAATVSLDAIMTRKPMLVCLCACGCEQPVPRRARCHRTTCASHAPSCSWRWRSR